MLTLVFEVNEQSGGFFFPKAKSVFQTLISTETNRNVSETNQICLFLSHSC
jgi:hypothetical protein